MSASFKGEGVKNWPNLLTDSSKKMLTGGARGQKSWKFANVLWSLSQIKEIYEWPEFMLLGT